MTTRGSEVAPLQGPELNSEHSFDSNMLFKKWV